MVLFFFFAYFEWDEILCVYVGFVCNALYGVILVVGMLLLNISSFTYVIFRVHWDTYFSTTYVVLFLITCSLIFVMFHKFWSTCGAWFLSLYFSFLLRCYNFCYKKFCLYRFICNHDFSMALITRDMMFWLCPDCCALFIWFNALFVELTRLLCIFIDGRRYAPRPLFLVLCRVKNGCSSLKKSCWKRLPRSCQGKIFLTYFLFVIYCFELGFVVDVYHSFIFLMSRCCSLYIKKIPLMKLCFSISIFIIVEGFVKLLFSFSIAYRALFIWFTTSFCC